MTKQAKSLTVWILFAAASLVIFTSYFQQAFPTASIALNLNKDQVLAKAADYVKSQGFDLAKFDRAMLFDSDFGGSVYMQKTLGIKRCNELVLQGVPIWSWRVRWFKELEKEGFYVNVDPATGEIIHFQHNVMEDDPGADLTQETALGLVETKLVQMGINLSDYELKDKSSQKRKNRTDHSFEWEKKGFKAGEATLRIRAAVNGDKLGDYTRFLKVPETFFRELKKETSFGSALTRLSTTLMYVLMLSAIGFILFRVKGVQVNWQMGFIAGVVVLVLQTISFFNELPLVWNYYPDESTKIVFLLTSLINNFNYALGSSVMVFAFGSMGDLIARAAPGRNVMPFLTMLRSPALPRFKDALPIFIVGYSFGFIFLGYITLFYIFGQSIFHIWMPPDTAYSNILGTFVPFLFPLTIAVTAAVSEEFMYRLLAVSFVRNVTRFLFLALVLPAVLWGFAHSSYPVFPTYVRGIELTIFGTFFGLMFLKYGLECVIIAHFVIDAAIVSMPLLNSHNPYFIISGVIVICLAFAPLLAMALLVRQRRVHIIDGA